MNFIHGINESICEESRTIAKTWGNWDGSAVLQMGSGQWAINILIKLLSSTIYSYEIYVMQYIPYNIFYGISLFVAHIDKKEHEQFENHCTDLTKKYHEHEKQH